MTTPTTFIYDIIGQNGTPFRFILTPAARPWKKKDNPAAPMIGSVRYFDRRYTYTEKDDAYRPGHYDENGQNCGPAMVPRTFVHHNGTGMEGWHDVSAWDLDRRTMSMVGDWVEEMMLAYAVAKGLRWQSFDEVGEFEEPALVPAAAQVAP